MILQKLNKNDIEQIQQLELITFEENSYTLDEINNFSENKNFLFVVKKIDNSIIGYAIIFLSVDLIEIYKISVSNFYRKKYIGSKIIDEIKSLKKDIIIEVSDRDFTKEFYEKNNFKIIHLREKYYYDKSNALIMKWEHKN